MSRLVLVGAAGALVLALAFIGRRVMESSSEVVFEAKNKPPQAAPICPWREPESDLKAFFPGATEYRAQTYILSGQRTELSRRLGRAPTGEENALRTYQVYRANQVLGSVLTRRVKGSNGAIELVLAVDAGQRVCGLRLQRLREPEPVARALQSPEWSQTFIGKRADGPWDLTGELSHVPAEARDSAEAIVDGTRSLLVLLAAAEKSAPLAPITTHSH